MGNSQEGTAVLVVISKGKEASKDATIVVTGALNSKGFLNEQTSQDCRRAALEYLGRVSPVNHFSKNEIVKKTIKCSVFIVVRSTERKDEFREKAVEQMKYMLVNCGGVPSENIIVLKGRRPQDVSEGILKHKLPQSVLVVVEKKPLSAKWNLMAISLKKNGLDMPQYIDPSTPILLRRRDDRKKEEPLRKVGNSTS